MNDLPPFVLEADRGAPTTVAFCVKVNDVSIDLRIYSGSFIIDNKPDLTLALEVDPGDSRVFFFVMTKAWTAKLGNKNRPARIEVRNPDGTVMYNRYGSVQAGGFDA